MQDQDKQLYLSSQQFQQRGLASSIGPHKGHPRVQINSKLQVFINIWLHYNKSRGLVHEGGSEKEYKHQRKATNHHFLRNILLCITCSDRVQSLGGGAQLRIFLLAKNTTGVRGIIQLST